MTTYSEASQKAIDFIKKQMNVNNYTLFPTFNEQYSEDYTKRVSGSVDMPPDATIVFPKYVYCDSFYTEKYTGIVSGKHQNLGTARKNLGIEVGSSTDGRYTSAVCYPKSDGTWRSEQYVRATETYSYDGQVTKRVTYWYVDDVTVNESGSNGIKDFLLKYYIWEDDQGNPIDPDNLPAKQTEVVWEPPPDENGNTPSSELTNVDSYTLDPKLVDNAVVDDAVPRYLDYVVEFYAVSDVEYLVDTINLLCDDVVQANQLPTNPPILPTLPEPWLKDVIFTPYTSTDELAVSWVGNFNQECTLTINGSNYTVLPQSIDDGYISFQTSVPLVRGSQYSYTISGNGVTLNGTIDYPSGNFYRIIGDAQLTDQTSAQNWWAAQDILGKHGNQPTLILSAGDQVDSIVDAELTAQQYTWFVKDQSVPIMVTRGNHDKNDAFFGHFKLPNADGGDYHFIHNNILFIVLDTNHKDYEKHKTTINQGLSSGTYDWAVLMMHHGLYTAGSHAKDQTVVDLRNALSDFIDTSGIDFILSGHDHIYSRTTDSTNKMYLTAPTSSGSKYYSVDTTLPWADVYSDVRPYGVIDMLVVSANQIDFSVIGDDGTIIDEFSVTK